MMIPAAPFEPDKLDLDGETSRLVRNVYAKGNSYGPIPGPVVFAVDPLPAACLGIWPYQTADGSYGLIAGTKTKLYRLVAGAWEDYTRTTGGDYNVPDGEFWSATQFGSNFIVCNANDDPQVLDVDSAATAFDALGGTASKHRIVKSVQDFVWMVGSLLLPSTVRWSEFNDSEDWIPDPSNGGQSDAQYFPEAGRIMNVTGGRTGFVFGERMVYAFEYTGPGLIYQFAKVDGVPGCVAPYSVASMGAFAWYYSERGFFQIGPDGPKPIGATRVDEWWRLNTDPARKSGIFAIADPVAPRVIWAGYSSAGVTSFDIGLIYDWQLDRWAEFRGEAQIWAAMASPGVTLEELDDYGPLEDLPASLDSPIWAGSKPTFGGVNASGQLMFMSGPNMEATITLPRIQPNPGGVAYINEVRPVTDTDEAMLRIGTVRRMQDASVTYSGSYVMDEDGKYSVRETGRIFEFEQTIPAGANWTHFQGLDPKVQADGAR